ncbi:MAG: acyltransferase family protein [Chitinophagaceae bacterium]|nr:acyltransferase family protein [Chitinophagaceae bacterium]MCW5926143.1 acyltransferase family protein [Chitinophagaceae bacterium]
MRRYDLDWLRVLAFSLLIMHHVSFFFVPWEWVVKNNIVYKWMAVPMQFMSQWRLPLLFLISGMGTFYALSKKTGSQFLRERFKRLIIPLVIAMIFITPPQTYIERLEKGQFDGSFFEFFTTQAFNGFYPEGNIFWHHLWFLCYLFIFCIVLLPAFLYIRKHPEARIIQVAKRITASPLGIYSVLIPLYIPLAFLYPIYPHNLLLVGDWYALSYYPIYFFYGFVLVSAGETFFVTAQKYRKGYLVAALVLTAVYMAFKLRYETGTLAYFVEPLLKVINAWSWLLALFGFAHTYCNKRSAALTYANEAVYPFYILHQTIIVIIGYNIKDWEMGFAGKFLIIAAATFGGCWILYEFVIRRIKWLRPLFGLKR